MLPPESAIEKAAVVLARALRLRRYPVRDGVGDILSRTTDDALSDEIVQWIGCRHVRGDARRARRVP